MEFRPGMRITREMVIADMIRVASVSPAPLTRDQYIRLSGKWYLASMFDKLGGWRSLRDAAGLTPPKGTKLPHLQPAVDPLTLSPEMRMKRELVIADIVRVARLSPVMLTRDRYTRLSGNLDLAAMLDTLGGWRSLRAAAGLKPPKPAKLPRVKRSVESVASPPEIRMTRDCVIADIIRVAGLTPGRLTKARYLGLCGDRCLKSSISKFGGWQSLRVAAGLYYRKAPKPPRVKPDRETLHRDIVQDIIRVAEEIKLPSNSAFPFRLYREHGGRYRLTTVRDFGWGMLCQEAGWHSMKSGGDLTLDRDFRADPTRSAPELERLLDQALGRTAVAPRGFRKLIRGAKRRGPSFETIVRKTSPLLDRGDLIADLRDIAARIGLRDLRLLTFEDYYVHGGQYGFEQFAPFGGFDTLRRSL